MKVEQKKLWKFVVYPLVLAFVNILFVRLLMSVYLNNIDMDFVLSDKTITFEPDINNIFIESSQKEDGFLERSEIEFPEVNTKYGKIEMESVDLSAPLIFGDTKEALKAGICQYSGSFIPGFGGMVLLTGHNYIYPQVEKMKIGDIIKITTSYGVYKYQVTNIEVLNKEKYETFNIDQNKERLVYYTCYPFNAFGNISDRYFVFADYVSGPKIRVEGETN